MECLKVIETISTKSPEDDPQDYLKDGLLYCHKCHTPKQLMIELHFAQRKMPCLCDCQNQWWNAIKKRNEREEQKQYCKDLKNRGIQDGVLPDSRFEKSDGSNQKNMLIAETYVANFMENFYPKGSGLLLWGDVGTGKSHVASCIANALSDQGIPTLFTSVARINNELFSQPDKNQVLETLNYYKLLIIDDLETEQKSGFAMGNIFTVIDERYKSNQPLIVTTNLTLDELENPTQLAHKRIFDRILEKCTPIAFDGGNKRAEKRLINFEDARQQFGGVKSNG